MRSILSALTLRLALRSATLGLALSALYVWMVAA